MRMYRSLILLLVSILSSPVMAEALSQREIDRFVEQTPAIAKMILYVAHDFTRDEIDIWADGRVAMRPHLTLDELIYDERHRNLLDEVSRQGGYDDFAEYAHTADRIFSIAYSGFWVELDNTLQGENADRDPIDNLFEYIEDNRNPRERREKYALKLEERCNEQCLNPEDLEIVGGNYDAVAQVLGLKE